MERHLSAQKSFRYEISYPEKETDKILYVLHGYGQLSRFFIRKFETLYKDFIVVAPEGMHRFYLKGSSGRVGASWMTKEDREADIADNIHWLQKLDEEITKEFKPSEKHILGFSQGGATAARWSVLGNVHFDSIILWACVFPPDLKMDDETRGIRVEKRYFVIGSNDEYYGPEEQDQLIGYYRSIGFDTHIYRGNHDIDTDLLRKLYDPNSGKKR